MQTVSDTEANSESQLIKRAKQGEPGVCTPAKHHPEQDGETEEVNEMFQTAFPNIKEQYQEGPDGNGLPDEEEEKEEVAAEA